jgi:hypothetical protein
VAAPTGSARALSRGPGWSVQRDCDGRRGGVGRYPGAPRRRRRLARQLRRPEGRKPGERPPAPRPNNGRLFDRTFGERPRGSKIVRAEGQTNAQFKALASVPPEVLESLGAKAFGGLSGATVRFTSVGGTSLSQGIAMDWVGLRLSSARRARVGGRRHTVPNQVAGAVGAFSWVRAVGDGF